MGKCFESIYSGTVLDSRLCTEKIIIFASAFIKPYIKVTIFNIISQEL